MKVYIVRQNSMVDVDEFHMENICVFSNLQKAVDYAESMGFVKNENYSCPGKEYQIWTSKPKFDDVKPRVMFIDEFELL